MEIVASNDTEDPRLHDFFQRVDQTSCLGYHHPAYGRILGDVIGDLGTWLIALEQGRPVGCLPLREARGRYGVVVNALPFFGPNGAALVADATSPAAVRDALLDAFLEHARRPEVLSAVFYTPFLEDVEPYVARLTPDEVVSKFTQYLPLEETRDWPRRRRRDLGRARRAGFRLRTATSSDLRDVATIHHTGCAAGGIPEKPEAWLAGVLATQEASPEGPVRCTIAELEGEVAGGLIWLLGPRTASYAVPFSKLDLRSLQPGVLLVDDAVRQARARGARYWNFESSASMQHPVFAFKQGWGSRIGRFAVLCNYPNGRERIDAVAPEALRAAYPYYFVVPMGKVMGTFENEEEASRVDAS